MSPEALVRSGTEIISTLTGLGTLSFMVFTWIMLRRAAVKVDEMHQQTADLVVHTNSLTDRLVQTTGIAARAEGVSEERLRLEGDTPAGILAREAATAAALLIRTAVATAAELVKSSPTDLKKTSPRSP